MRKLKAVRFPSKTLRRMVNCTNVQIIKTSLVECQKRKMKKEKEVVGGALNPKLTKNHW